MREVELQVVQVEVHNVGELRFQSNSRLRRVTSTRILDQNLRQSVVLNNCFCLSTSTATTRDDNSRCRGVTSTRICNCNLGKDRCIEELQVDWECNLRTQGVVMGVTITKLIVFQSLDLTNLSTSEEHSSATTLIRDHNLNLTTRTRQCRSKDAWDSININRTEGISLTRVSQSNLTDGTRSSLCIVFNGDITETTFTITNN